MLPNPRSMVHLLTRRHFSSFPTGNQQNQFYRNHALLLQVLTESRGFEAPADSKSSRPTCGERSGTVSLKQKENKRRREPLAKPKFWDSAETSKAKICMRCRKGSRWTQGCLRCARSKAQQQRQGTVEQKASGWRLSRLAKTRDGSLAAALIRFGLNFCMG